MSQSEEFVAAQVFQRLRAYRTTPAAGFSPAAPTFNITQALRDLIFICHAAPGMTRERWLAASAEAWDTTAFKAVGPIS